VSLTNAAAWDSEIGTPWSNGDATPIWPATARYKLPPAPGGLALVQDFLNTRANDAHRTDLLRDSASAEEWAAHAVDAWSAQRMIDCQRPTLDDLDTVELRGLRGALDEALTGVPAAQLDRFFGVVQLGYAGAAEISWIPRGRGWRWFCAAILGEVMSSHNVGTWRRMKLCRNATCRAAFYDRTWDTSGVWHSPGNCGNPTTGNGQPWQRGTSLDRCC
jgi:predicted RNA-binding Zn ribbon-like protein